MTPVTYYAPDELTSPRFAFAFAKGCRGTVTDELDLFPGPVALFGSPSRWPVLRAAHAAGRDWFYADHAYFGRNRYYRITRNAYQHDGIGGGNPQRFRAHGRTIQPWRKTGQHVLVCPNSAVYCGLHGFDVEGWLKTVIATLRAHTDREIRVRWKTQTRAGEPIGPDLVNAWATVVFSSAAALDALIAGVPVFTLAPFAATSRMGLSDLSLIESPEFPADREEFLHTLASNQWTLPEIFTGGAWRMLQAEAERRAA